MRAEAVFAKASITSPAPLVAAVRAPAVSEAPVPIRSNWEEIDAPILDAPGKTRNKMNLRTAALRLWLAEKSVRKKTANPTCAVAYSRKVVQVSTYARALFHVLPMHFFLPLFSMAKAKKTQPASIVGKFISGNVSATVFYRKHKKDKAVMHLFHVSVQRGYMDASGERQFTASLNESDLLDASYVIVQAKGLIRELRDNVYSDVTA